MAINRKKAKDLIKKRTDIVNRLAEQLESSVKTSETALLREITEGFIDSLDMADGKIANTIRNKRLIALIDKIFDRFAQDHGLAIATGIVKGIQEIIDFNSKYFSSFTDSVKLIPINDNIKTTLDSWLGIGEKGAVTENGYLSTLVKSEPVRNSIKDFAVRQVVSGAGLIESRKELKSLIVGDQKNLGALQKYYRNFVYDTYSQVDRTAAKITADKLKLNYAIFEGPKLKTSRAWCVERKGKVFTREEISKFNPPSAKPPGYNPFTDLGGYGCVDSLNWIPDTLAFIMRPELKTALQ